MSAPLFVAALAGILAILAFLVASGGHEGVPVAVAGRDLAAGEVVAPGDFRFVDATLPAGTLKAMLRPADVNRIGGQVTTHAIAVGQPVGHPDVAPAAAPDQKRAMSIPIEQAHAVAGGLRRGDVVDIIDSSAGESRYVVTNARVLDVGSESGGGKGLSAGSSKYSVTVAVDDREALRLAAAVTAGKVDVVRATGAPSTAVTPPTTAVVKR